MMLLRNILVLFTLAASLPFLISCQSLTGSFNDHNIRTTNVSQTSVVILVHGGTGGVIALEPDGNYAFSFSTQMMFRGVKTDDTTNVYIFQDEGPQVGNN